MKAGEIADLAEIAATPAIIKACVKGIEKEGKAEFKVFGKKKTLSLGSPTAKPPETRPPPKSHTSPKTSETSSCAGGKKRAPCLRVETQWGTTTSDILPRTTKTCSGNQYTQACFHYQSVIRENPGYGTLTCPYNKALRAPRPAVALYDAQHNGGWITGWMQGPGLFCQRDEYPPADIWQGRGGQQWIRLIPRADNGGAGPALFGGNICSNPPRSSTVGSHLVRQWRQGNKETESWQRTVEITRSVLVLHFANMQPWADDGLRENPCWPSTLVNDPGFALLTQDERNDVNALAQLAAYARPPSLQVTQGKQNKPGYFRKRDASSDDRFDPSEIVFDDGNFTRPATDQELFKEFSFLRCQDKDCDADRKVLGIESAIIVATARDEPTTATASTTLANPIATMQDARQAGSVMTAPMPKITLGS